MLHRWADVYFVGVGVVRCQRNVNVGRFELLLQSKFVSFIISGKKLEESPARDTAMHQGQPNQTFV